MSDRALAAAEVPAKYQAPWWVHVLCGIIGLMFVVGGFYAHTRGLWWLVGLIAWFSSHGFLVFFRCVIGPYSLREAFDFSTQSWAMLLDVCLAACIAASSYNSRYLNPDGFQNQAWWLAVAFVPVLLFVVARYLKFDRPNYIREGLGALLGDPWKLFHDLVATVALGALLVAICLPALFSSTSWHDGHWMVQTFSLVAFLAWVSVLPHETQLNLRDLHLPFDWTTWRYDLLYRLQ